MFCARARGGGGAGRRGGGGRLDTLSNDLDGLVDILIGDLGAVGRRGRQDDLRAALEIQRQARGH